MKKKLVLFAAVAVIAFAGVADSRAGRDDGLGILAGTDTAPDDFFLGGDNARGEK